MIARGGELTLRGWAFALVERADARADVLETLAGRVYARGLRGRAATDAVDAEVSMRVVRLRDWAAKDEARRRLAAESAVDLGGWDALARLLIDDAAIV